MGSAPPTQRTSSPAKPSQLPPNSKSQIAPQPLAQQQATNASTNSSASVLQQPKPATLLKPTEESTRATPSLSAQLAQQAEDPSFEEAYILLH